MGIRQFLALLALAVAIAYAGFRFTGGYGLWGDDRKKFIISDIFSLVVVPSEQGECLSAVGYQDKHVIGTFVAEPIKNMVCREYYFRERPEAKFPEASVVLVRLDTGEYHWVLESQLVVPLRN
jgi:hypothetical protein